MTECALCHEPVEYDPTIGLHIHTNTAGLMCAPQTGALTQPALYATPKE